MTKKRRTSMTCKRQEAWSGGGAVVENITAVAVTRFSFLLQTVLRVQTFGSYATSPIQKLLQVKPEGAHINPLPGFALVELLAVIPFH